MNQAFISFLNGFIMGALIGLALVLIWRHWKKQSKGVRGVAEADDNEIVKDHHLRQILALFSVHEKVTNELVREKLGFGRRFVVRAMDELQKQSKVEQVEVTGLAVYYQLKK